MIYHDRTPGKRQLGMGRNKSSLCLRPPQCSLRIAAVILFVAASFLNTGSLKRQMITITRNDESESFCLTKGSLHQLAVGMFLHSSPPGTASYNKFKHVIDENSEFYVEMGGGHGIFVQNQILMDRMLYGYGLHNTDTKPLGHSNVTLVETIFTSSSCPLRTEVDCKDQARILIQTEQYFTNHVLLCHDAPNCVVLEFSDYNLVKARNHDSVKDLADSFVLLPVMTQSPTSRLSMYEPAVAKDPQSRSIDMVFFGLITGRREVLVELSNAYAVAHPDWIVRVGKDISADSIGRQYSEAKLCLVAHSYHANSGGEYHRLSEMAPFGCIPVMEHFSDKIGIDIYEKCAGIIFENVTNLVEAAVDVIAKIDQGYYNDRINAIVSWWRIGIQWETILQTVYGEEL